MEYRIKQKPIEMLIFEHIINKGNNVDSLLLIPRMKTTWNKTFVQFQYKQWIIFIYDLWLQIEYFDVIWIKCEWIV